jgi:hypothetical protein
LFQAEQRKTQVLPKIVYYSNRFCRTFACRFWDEFCKHPLAEALEGHFGENLLFRSDGEFWEIWRKILQSGEFDQAIGLSF